MITKAALATLAVVICSSTWLYMAWAHGNRTSSWTAVPAHVENNDVEKNARGRMKAWATTVSYAVDGKEYIAVVEDYLVGTTEVYVDPNDPTSVVGIPGASLRDYGRPLLLTVGSALFAIVLALIAFSPSEE
jgi:hypothetical protein